MPGLDVAHPGPSYLERGAAGAWRSRGPRRDGGGCAPAVRTGEIAHASSLRAATRRPHRQQHHHLCMCNICSRTQPLPVRWRLREKSDSGWTVAKKLLSGPPTPLYGFYFFILARSCLRCLSATSKSERKTGQRKNKEDEDYF